MASTSTQTVSLPERPVERVEKISTERPAAPQPKTGDEKFVIKLAGSIPH